MGTQLPSQKGGTSGPPQFLAHVYVAKRSPISATAEHLFHVFVSVHGLWRGPEELTITGPALVLSGTALLYAVVRIHVQHSNCAIFGMQSHHLSVQQTEK